MTSIGIIGAQGRMGQAIHAAAMANGERISGGIDRDGAIFGDHASAAVLASASDVLIDFSAPVALGDTLAAARASKRPVVIGTTGLKPEHHAMIDEAAREIAVLQTGNTSLGVNLLAALVKIAAERLGPEWDIEILEMHHRHKVDAPSGTALLLGNAAAEGRGGAPAVLNRYDQNQSRPEGTIGYASLRGGSVAGDHQVILATDNERIEIGHRAENRSIFATGALKAANWIVGQPAGRYDMRDVLGLK